MEHLKNFSDELLAWMYWAVTATSFYNDAAYKAYIAFLNEAMQRGQRDGRPGRDASWLEAYRPMWSLYINDNELRRVCDD